VYSIGHLTTHAGESWLPPSIYRIDPVKDLPLAEEFRRNPIGHHSANLQCILNLFRGEPLAGKYVLVCIKPHEEWQLGILSGVRGQAVELLRGHVYRDLKEAEWAVFKRRWHASTGQELPLP
jgi:branched-chain amino acid transport system permease protein